MDEEIQRQRIERRIKNQEWIRQRDERAAVIAFRREEVLRLRGEGVSVVAIAHQVGASAQRVRQIIEHDEGKKTTNLEYPGAAVASDDPEMGQSHQLAQAKEFLKLAAHFADGAADSLKSKALAETMRRVRELAGNIRAVHDSLPDRDGRTGRNKNEEKEPTQSGPSTDSKAVGGT